jgi:hypothetical protein
MVKPGVQNEGYNHYSLIRTIEENFQLGTLGKNDQHSNWFQFLWGRHFDWRTREATPLAAGGPMAFVCHQGFPTLAFRDIEQRLCVARYQGAAWTQAEVVVDAGDEPFALAVANDTLYLVSSSKDGIEQRTFEKSGWSTPSQILSSGPVRSLALAAFDEDRQLMLVWSDESGRIFSLTHTDGTWATESVVVGGRPGEPFATGGSICLAILGRSIFCIYEAAKTEALMVVSYNCADCNIIEAGPSEYSGPYNNTTKNLWSPSAFPVEAFNSSPSPWTPGEPEPMTDKFPGLAPLACAMSISGLLTPKLPVSYASSDQKTTNNGYGTLAQASWTEQRPIDGTELGLQLALAMCREGQRLWLAYAEPSGSIAVVQGATSS